MTIASNAESIRVTALHLRVRDRDPYTPTLKKRYLHSRLTSHVSLREKQEKRGPTVEDFPTNGNKFNMVTTRDTNDAYRNTTYIALALDLRRRHI